MPDEDQEATLVIRHAREDDRVEFEEARRDFVVVARYRVLRVGFGGVGGSGAFEEEGTCEGVDYGDDVLVDERWDRVQAICVFAHI